jgi:hypothetical protein
MSGDGRAIAFGTGEGLIPRDANGRADFYLWQEGRSQPTLITAETLAPRMRIAAHGRVRRDGRILVRLACPSAETRGPCRARVAIKRSRRGRALGRGTFEVGVGKRRWVAVRVRKRGPRPRRVVLVGVRGSDTLGNTAVVRRRVALAGIRSR